MKYIFLVAGKGSRLSPLTSDIPKSMFQIGIGYHFDCQNGKSDQAV